MVTSQGGGGAVKRRKWDSETKARVVLDGLLNGQVSDVCRQYDIRPGQYYKWRDYFLKHSARVFEGPPRSPDMAALAAENEKLKRLVGELTLELNQKGNT
jgi:transposase-like protein